MTRAASGPELRWRSCAALPRRTSPTFETLWSSTRVMRMLSRSPNSESLRVYVRATRYTPRSRRTELPAPSSGVVRTGPHAGQLASSKVSTMTAAKWSKVAATHNYGVEFERATHAQLKQAALHLLEAHLAACEAEGQAN